MCPTSGGMVTLKTERREVPGSNPCRACRPSRLEFSLVFSEIRVNTGEDPLERPPTEDAPPIVPGPPSRKLDSNLHLSLRKTSTERTSPLSAGTLCIQMALICNQLTKNRQFMPIELENVLIFVHPAVILYTRYN